MQRLKYQFSFISYKIKVYSTNCNTCQVANGEVLKRSTHSVLFTLATSLVTIKWYPLVISKILNVKALSHSTKSLYASDCTYHSDPVSNGLRRQVASELGTHHATVSVSTSYLSPDDSGFVRFAARSHCVADFKRE